MMKQLLFPFLALFCFALEQRFASANPLLAFGTDSGYDRGGEDPVCWISKLGADPVPRGYVKLPAVGDEEPTIHELDDLLFRGGFESSEALSNCYPGTSLQIQAQNQKSEPFHPNERLTFTIDVETKDSTLCSNETLKGAVVTSYTRVVLCHVVRSGFCTPMVDLSDQAGVSSRLATDTQLISEWATIPPANSRNFTVEAQLTIPDDILAGQYFAVGHAVTSFFISQDRVIRYDVSNVIPERVIKIKVPPVLLEVSLGTKVVLGCFIVVFASLALFMLIYVIVRRNEPVMRLAQGKFLAAITLGCLIQIVSSFVFLPTKDIYCQVFGLLILLPMTFVGSCLVGRVWRVHKTLSMAQTVGRCGTESGPAGLQVERGLISFLDSLANLAVCKKSKMNKRRSLRETVTDTETSGLIALLTFPQLVFQIYVFCLNRGLVMIEDENFARLACEPGTSWTTGVGLLYMIVIQVLSVSMAWVTRSLPSMFNEKDQIFRAASLTTAFAFLSIALWMPITDAATSPFVSVVLQASLSVSVPMIVLVTIILPKIKRSVSGEKVVMSNIVSARAVGHIPRQLSSYLLERKSSYSAHGSHALDRKCSFSGHGGSAPFDRKYSFSGHGGSSPFDRRAMQLPTIESGIEEDEEVDIKSTRTLVKANEPLPAEFETMLLGTQGIIREITKRISYGRAVLPSQISELQGNVSVLAMQLEFLDVEGTIPEN